MEKDTSDDNPTYLWVLAQILGGSKFFHLGAFHPLDFHD